MDSPLFNLINGLAFKWVRLDFFGIFFARYSGYYLAGILFFLFVFRFKKYCKMVITAIVSGVLARFIIAEIIRFLWNRPRPFDILENINLLLPSKSEASFPSGHASFYFAVSTVVFLYNKKLGYLFFSVSLLMGLARIFIGYHWPSDILAGALIGIFSGFLIYKFSKKYFSKSDGQ